MRRVRFVLPGIDGICDYDAPRGKYNDPPSTYDSSEYDPAKDPNRLENWFDQDIELPF